MNLELLDAEIFTFSVAVFWVSVKLFGYTQSRIIQNIIWSSYMHPPSLSGSCFRVYTGEHYFKRYGKENFIVRDSDVQCIVNSWTASQKMLTSAVSEVFLVSLLLNVQICFQFYVLITSTLTDFTDYSLDHSLMFVLLMY